MFARDRDLLALEPTLFRDIGWRAQERLSGQADLSAGTLTLTSFDIHFAAAGVTRGHIVLAGGGAGAEAVPLEVLERLSDTQVTVSRLRGREDDEPVPPADAAAQPISVRTFAPQIALAHEELLRLAGVAPAGCAWPCASDVMNSGDLRTAEALSALALVFSAAAGTPGHAAPVYAQRAERYRRLAARAREQTAVQLAGADGRHIATRRFNIGQLHR
jgi:hypothetical protein